MLRYFLTDRDAACPLCGYNLRNLTHTTCPECGREITLGVSLTARYVATHHAAWLTLLITTCMGAGIGILAVCLLLYNGPPRGHPAILVLAFYYMAQIPLIVAVVAARQRLLTQRRRAIILALVSVFFFLLMLMLLLRLLGFF